MAGASSRPSRCRLVVEGRHAGSRATPPTPAWRPGAGDARPGAPCDRRVHRASGRARTRSEHAAAGPPVHDLRHRPSRPQRMRSRASGGETRPSSTAPSVKRRAAPSTTARARPRARQRRRALRWPRRRTASSTSAAHRRGRWAASRAGGRSSSPRWASGRGSPRWRRASPGAPSTTAPHRAPAFRPRGAGARARRGRCRRRHWTGGVAGIQTPPRGSAFG